MSMSDPIADMLTRIRNANTAKHDTVDVPASKMKVAIADILVNEGYIAKYDLVGEAPHRTIRITLKYGADKNEKIITGLKRISKPGLRIYVNKEELREFWAAWESPFCPPTRRDHRQGGKKASGRRRGSGICLVKRRHPLKATENRREPSESLPKI